MKRFVFYVPTTELDLLEFLGNLTNDNKLSETTLRVMKFIMDNGFEELQNVDALKKEKIRVDIDYKRAATELIQAKLKYTYNFESLPSKAGSGALKKKNKQDITGHQPIEYQKVEELIAIKWSNYLAELRVTASGWKFVCRLCQVAFLEFKTKESAIERFKLHLEESHSEELMRINPRQV